MTDNICEDLYIGSEPAWHRIGINVGRLFSADDVLSMLPEYAYDVVTVPQYARWKGDEIPTGAKATIRVDTNEVLGTVGPTYQVVQNIEAFKPFDEVCGPDHAYYTSVGVLGNGETIFVVAKLPDKFMVKQDLFEQYLTLTNSHNGRHALRVYVTPVRVVCNNTLNMSLKQISAQVLLRHTKNVHSRLLDAGKVLGLASKEFLKVQEMFQTLAERSLVAEEFETYVQSVFATTGENPNQRTLDHWAAVGERFDADTNRTPGLDHTAYSAFQSVVEYVDHGISTNVGTDRAVEALFGRGAKVKEKALHLALDIAK